MNYMTQWHYGFMSGFGTAFITMYLVFLLAT